MIRKNRKPNSAFYRSENAVATAVAAALLLGIVIAFLTNIQVHYVPEWREDAEYSHMSEVWEDMSRLKSNADILAAGLKINPDSSIILSSPIRMGGGELPVFGKMKSGGTLIFNSAGCEVHTNIEILNESNVSNIFDCGSVTYRSSNTEYIDQVFCYENGALIVSQGSRSLLKLSPAIILDSSATDVNFSITTFSLKGSSGVLSSNAVEEVKLTSVNMDPDIDISGREFSTKSITITIYTENNEAWETYLNDLVMDANLKADDYTLTNNGSTVEFYLHPSEKYLNLKLNGAVIKTETGIQ